MGAVPSETIRELLKFAISEIKKEKKFREEKKFHYEIINELQEIKKLQQDNHDKVIRKMDKGISISNTDADVDDSGDAEKVNKSIESSIDSMINLFGMEDN